MDVGAEDREALFALSLPPTSDPAWFLDAGPGGNHAGAYYAYVERISGV
ncbi:MAG: hypothetical protein U5J83_06325 [Bryobacterales bacterium]|nr:hypothetical protein [Bryobacterales bacterium]